MMRFYFLLFCLTGILFHTQAQTETDTLVYEQTDSTITPPVFPGGDQAYGKYISSRLMYPADAKNKGLQGITYIEFIIEKDGSLSNFKVVEGKSFSSSCDREAIRVISSSPKWTPGMKNGVPIRTKMIQKIRFALSGSTTNKKNN